MNRLITSKLLEKIVNQYLQLDPEVMHKLSAYEGKVLCVDVIGVNRQYYLLPQEDKVEIRTEFESTADTIIRGAPSALIKLGMQSDTAALMLSGEIEIIGDVRLGRELKKCLSNLKIDWEEHFSSVIGDVPAHLAFKAISKITTWTKQTVSTLKMDVSEYLQEESRDIVSGAEMYGFNTQVDRLRDDVDRLEATLKHRTE